jgi:hypothetical protein
MPEPDPGSAVCSATGCPLAAVFGCTGTGPDEVSNASRWCSQAPRVVADLTIYVNAHLDAGITSGNGVTVANIGLHEYNSDQRGTIWEAGWRVASGTSGREVTIAAFEDTPNEVSVGIADRFITIGTAPWVDHQRSEVTKRLHAELCQVFSRRVIDTVSCAIQLFSRPDPWPQPASRDSNRAYRDTPE